MYKQLLNKGFTPVYYTNKDFMETRSTTSRLFYRCQLTTTELLNSILSALDIFDKYFWVLENKKLKSYLETDEKFEHTFIYFEDSIADIIEIQKDKANQIINMLPNNFTFQAAK